MRQLSQVLNDLIAIAEGVVTRSRYAAPVSVTAFGAVAAEVRAAEQRPAAEGRRATYGAIVVVNAIEAFFAADGAETGSRWQMIVGAALPLLRADAWTALNQEKAAQQEARR